MALSQLFIGSTDLQTLAGWLALLFALAALIMTAYWANDSRTDLDYLGGINWGRRTFSWHPVLMVAGAILSSITAVVSYRTFPLTKAWQKTIHGLMHTAAVVCLGVGLAAILSSHNYKSRNMGGVYRSNFTTIHTFLGTAVIVLYGLNYLMGMVHFLIPGINEVIIRSYARNHIFIGSFILVLSLGAVETGLMLLTDSCGYDVTRPDVNPAANYHRLSPGCLLANSIGIVVLAAVFLALYSIFRFVVAPPDAIPLAS